MRQLNLEHSTAAQVMSKEPLTVTGETSQVPAIGLMIVIRINGVLGGGRH